jgi:small conductance mechanosensitive channel
MGARFLWAFLLAFCLSWPLAGQPACAQSLAVHQAAAPAATAPAAATTAATAAAPAKPASSAIIPGSPLAVLTGAAPAAPAGPEDIASPYGTDNLGLSITTVIGDETTHTINAFLAAVRRSTALTPVIAWLQSLPGSPSRLSHATDIAAGLGLCVLPALLVEIIIRALLVRPRKALIARAISQLPPVEPATGQTAGLADAEAGETEKRPRKKLSFLAWSRRMLRGLVYLLLTLLPIIGFAVTVGVLLGTGLISTRAPRLAIIGLSNAYLLCRFILEALRFVFAPKVPALRLIAVSTLRANWITRWARALLFTAAAGYAVISICELLGLGKDGTKVLLRLLVLASHLELALIIWQSRKVVAAWIAGDPQAEGFIAITRRRFASIWYILALFYIFALWIAWAGGVQNAFGLLLRAVLVFLAAVIGGRLAWTGSGQLLDRLFPETKTTASRHAHFYARARAYKPFTDTVFRIIIGVAVLVVILQGWGINILPWLLKDQFSRSLVSAFIAIIITITVAFVLWEVSNAFINGRIGRLSGAGQTRQASRLRTLLPMLQATIGVSIFLVAGLICLSKIGVNAAPLLAGAGVLGIAIGFGSQKLVQDIITGLFLLLEDAMQVGDVISLASMTGTVERLSIRTIRLRGGDGSINIIPFSAVTTVTNMTRDFGTAQISIQVAYEEDLPRVYAVLTDISRNMRAEPTWGAMMRDDLQIFGLDQFGPSALVITGQIRTGPGQHWAVRREFNGRIKARFEAEHIEIPYTYFPPAPPRPAALPADEKITPGAEKEA